MLDPQEMIQISNIFEKFMIDAVVVTAVKLWQNLERLDELPAVFRRDP